MSSARPTTKHERLLGYLRARLGDCTWSAGQRLPTEAALAAQFGVNRNTAARALGTLASEGLVVRRRGGGTRVAATTAAVAARPAVALAEGVVGIVYSLNTADPNHVAYPAKATLDAFEVTLAAAAPRLRIAAVNLPGSRQSDLDRIASLAPRLRGVVVLDIGSIERRLGEHLDVVRRLRVPLVVVGDHADVPGCDVVRCDQSAFGAIAARHLVDLGHRRLLFVGPDIGARWLADRIEGFRRAVVDAGLRFSLEQVIRCGERLDWHAEGAQRGGERAARIVRRRDCTGIVAVNDAYAVGLLRALRAEGVRAPDEVSLIGMDDALPARDHELASVRPPAAAMGEAAARLLVERIGAATGDRCVSAQLRPTLVSRASAAAPPAA